MNTFGAYCNANSDALLQRKCACGSPVPASANECAECKQTRLQQKLQVGTSNDSLEREADGVADQVLASPVHVGIGKAPLRIQRATAQSTEGAPTVPRSVDRVLADPGRSLDSALRHDMEHRFGHDFSKVRIHSGGMEAEQSTRDVHAHAYTVGHDIVFGAGQFAPQTHSGRRLLAHELTHVVQQRAGAPSMQRKPKGDLPPVKAPSLDSFVDPRSLCGGRDCAEVQALIDAPVKEMEQRDEAELKQRKQAQLQDLRAKTDLWKEDEDFMRDKLKQPKPSAWRDDQAFAMALLEKVLERNVAPDPRGVADFVRAPVVQRYEAWLKSTDAKAFDESKGGRARGPGELHDLESRLRIFRGADHTAADTVLTAVLEYRKKTDPYWLWTQGYASDMVSAGVAIASGVAEKGRKAPPVDEPEPPKTKPPAQLPPAKDPADVKPPATPPTAPPTTTTTTTTKTATTTTTTTTQTPPPTDVPVKQVKKATTKKVAKAKTKTKTQAKDVAEETEAPTTAKKKKTDDKPKATKPPPAAVPEDPQQGVKDAIARADKRVAEGRVEIDKYNKRIDAARAKAKTLRDDLNNMPKDDPGRAKAVTKLEKANKKVDDLVGERDQGPIASNQKDQATAARLRKALDEQTYARPSWRSDMRQKVWDNAMKEGKGTVLSPSGKPLKFEDDWVIGHKPKYEFRKHQESAAKRGISREQFREEYNRDATHYRPETKGDNSSRKYEDRTDDYLGF